jgi:SAM-dependent methyltransferase
MSNPSNAKAAIRRVPLLGGALAEMSRLVRHQRFEDSRTYWEQRYAEGGTSGAGSAGPLARFKAEVLNDFVARHGVRSVIEFGCGDGQQLALAEYPRYLGLDVSATTIARTMELFREDRSKGFALYDPARFTDPAGVLGADLALSLDVIYHLVEDDVYDRHLAHVFGAARRYVALYTSDADVLSLDEPPPAHVRHRPVLRDVHRLFPGWRLLQRIPNRYPYRSGDPATSFADFLFFAREDAGTP